MLESALSGISEPSLSVSLHVVNRLEMGLAAYASGNSTPDNDTGQEHF